MTAPLRRSRRPVILPHPSRYLSVENLPHSGSQQTFKIGTLDVKLVSNWHWFYVNNLDINFRHGGCWSFLVIQTTFCQLINSNFCMNNSNCSHSCQEDSPKSGIKTQIQILDDQNNWFLQQTANIDSFLACRIMNLRLYMECSMDVWAFPLDNGGGTIRSHDVWLHSWSLATCYRLLLSQEFGKVLEFTGNLTSPLCDVFDTCLAKYKIWGCTARVAAVALIRYIIATLRVFQKQLATLPSATALGSVVASKPLVEEHMSQKKVPSWDIYP